MTNGQRLETLNNWGGRLYHPLLEHLLKMVSGAKILCGDLNLLPTTQSLALLEQGMRNLVKAYGITSKRSRFYEGPERFADYVLVSKEVQIKEFHILDEEVSD